MAVRGHSISSLGVKAYESLVFALQIEAQRKLIWAPVFVVGGCWIYFALSAEPGLSLSAVLACAALLALTFKRQHLPLFCVALVCVGFSGMKFRENLVATPQLRAFERGIHIKGHVFDVTVIGKKRTSLIVDVFSAAGLGADEVPVRVKVDASIAGPKPQIGDAIVLTADLKPLPRPVAPYGFDYGRSLYFRSIGATGYATEVRFETPVQVEWQYKSRRFFHALRLTMSERIQRSIAGPIGAFADALITGERASIPKAMNDSLQKSGLFHILSISGLHMSLVAGGVFWVTRALLALSPRLALRFPIKKWAALIALLVGLIYMLLADGGPATERSYIMIAIAFFAVLVDRPAISMQNLALAALIILALRPEQSIDAGFQMSFLAVMGLAALYEWTARRKVQVYTKQSRTRRYATKAARAALMSVAASFVAGNFSGLAAAYHFSRFSSYGVASNALALPAVSFIVMPMAAASVALMPFGLESYPLRAMEFGLKTVMSVSDWVAGWSHASIDVGRPTVASTMAFAAALVIFSLAASRLRWLAVLFLATGLMLKSQPQPPLILIDEKAQNVSAVINGKLDVALPKFAKFSTSSWQNQLGLEQMTEHGTSWACTQEACQTSVGEFRVALLLRAAETSMPCIKTDILISQYPLRRSCAGKQMTIDRFDVWKSGSIVISNRSAGLALTTSVDVRGKRPWSYAPRAKSRLQTAKNSTQ